MTRTVGEFAACAALLFSVAAVGCDSAPKVVTGDQAGDGITTAAAGVAVVSSSVQVVAEFDAGEGEFPEGIAARAGGGIYVGMSGLGEIRRVLEDGTTELVTTILLEPEDLGVLGLTFSAAGVLYAAVVSSSDAVRGVWRIGRDGAAAHLAGTEAMAFPNDLAFDRRGNLYVTDSALGAVWRVSRDGAVVMWAQDHLLSGTGDFGLDVPIGANGIVFVPGRAGGGSGGQGGQAGRLLVANTERGQLVEIPVLPDGSAGTAALLVASPDLLGLDGIAVDEHGRIFGAVNVQNTIVVATADGSSVQSVATSGLDFPAGVVFGTAGRDRHSLFVTNFALINDVDPSPGVVKLDMGPPGRR